MTALSHAMRTYTFQLTLFDCAFVFAAFVLLGTGLGIMALDGFDAWFAYLLALPTVGALAKVHSGFTSKE